jgi:hypothetical protein
MSDTSSSLSILGVPFCILELKACWIPRNPIPLCSILHDSFRMKHQDSSHSYCLVTLGRLLANIKINAHLSSVDDSKCDVAHFDDQRARSDVLWDCDVLARGEAGLKPSHTLVRHLYNVDGPFIFGVERHARGLSDVMLPVSAKNYISCWLRPSTVTICTAP